MLSTNENTLQLFLRYNAWANQQIYQAIAELKPAQSDEKSIVLVNKMTRALNHSLIAGLVWQAYLQGKSHYFTERYPKDFPPLATLVTLQQQLDTWYLIYSQSLAPEALKQSINFTLIDGQTGVMTREEILLHVVNHTTYHRGFIAQMFYELAIKPPTTDLTAFLQEARHTTAPARS